jgi:hypothetical protein
VQIQTTTKKSGFIQPNIYRTDLINRKQSSVFGLPLFFEIVKFIRQVGMAWLMLQRDAIFFLNIVLNM